MSTTGTTWQKELQWGG